MQALGAELECRGDQSDEALCVTVRWLSSNVYCLGAQDGKVFQP